MKSDLYHSKLYFSRIEHLFGKIRILRSMMKSILENFSFIIRTSCTERLGAYIESNRIETERTSTKSFEYELQKATRSKITETQTCSVARELRVSMCVSFSACSAIILEHGSTHKTEPNSWIRF